MAERAEDNAEAGRGFALAFAGIDDHQTFFIGLGRQNLVTHGLLLAHLVGVALVDFRFGQILQFL